MTEPVTIAVEAGLTVSGLLERPGDARALYVLAHGAGAGMRHAFLESLATRLAARGVATLRYQFPYMEAGAKRPDPPALAQATVRAAVAQAATFAPDLPLVAGGKSFGGRMTSQAQAESPFASVRGLAFVGFPLHAAGAPSETRAAHLADVALPMLLLQGTNDALAEWSRIERVAARLGQRATLVRVDGADHAFHMPKRSGRTDAEVLDALADALATWVDAVVARASA